MSEERWHQNGIVLNICAMIDTWSTWYQLALGRAWLSFQPWLLLFTSVMAVKSPRSLILSAKGQMNLLCLPNVRLSHYYSDWCSQLYVSISQPGIASYNWDGNILCANVSQLGVLLYTYTSGPHLYTQIVTVRWEAGACLLYTGCRLVNVPGLVNGVQIISLCGLYMFWHSLIDYYGIDSMCWFVRACTQACIAQPRQMTLIQSRHHSSDAGCVGEC